MPEKCVVLINHVLSVSKMCTCLSWPPMELLFLGVVYPLVGRLSQCAVLGTDTGLDARLMNLLVVSTLYPGDGED